MNSSATPAEIHLVEAKLQSLLPAKGIAEITIERELKNEVKKMRSVKNLGINLSFSYPTLSMTFLKVSFSILLSILMANPGCCCTFKNALKPTDKESVRSCCSKQSLPTDGEESPNECPDCPCEEITAAHESKSAFHIGTVFELEIISPEPEHLAVHFPKELPRQNSPPENRPPDPDLWLLFGSLLL